MATPQTDQRGDELTERQLRTKPGASLTWDYLQFHAYLDEVRELREAIVNVGVMVAGGTALLTIAIAVATVALIWFR